MKWIRAVFVPAVLFASTALAQGVGSDTCRSGFVWREAFAGDHVCVDPRVRAQAVTDNLAAASRRQPGGGPYGRDTCRQGFVWREARPDDHVCVTPDIRTQAANDNRAAADRVAQVIALVPLSTPPPPRPRGTATKRGFDDQGNGYIEDLLPDGSRRREQRNGVTVIRPDGSTQYHPNMVMHQNAQAPTPPQLPANGMAWVNYHNLQLLELISLMVNNDERQLALFHRGEDKKVGTDPFKQIGYRMQVLDDLAKP